MHYKVVLNSIFFAVAELHKIPIIADEVYADIVSKFDDIIPIAIPRETHAKYCGITY